MNKIEGIIFDWHGTLADRDHSIFDFSKTVLTELKNRGYKLGLISTSKNIKERKQIIAQSGLQSFFDVVLVNTTKTIEHFKQCIDQIGTSPKTTCIVDDRTIRGIKYGNQLGCTTFWIQRGKFENELPNDKTDEPTHRINTVTELLNFL